MLLMVPVRRSKSRYTCPVIAVRTPRPLKRRVLLLAAFLAVVVAAEVDAQFGQRGFGGHGFLNVSKAAPEDFDGRFNFCRVAFSSDLQGDGANWSVDYPRADINLSIRLAELTKTAISRDAANNPNHLLVQLTDAELFQCPFTMMTEVGSASFSEDEAEQLRLYLEKGGFLWADDFWGSYAWDWWVAQLRKVLPADEYSIIDLPPEHPLFHGFFDITHTPQIPSIGFWAGSGGGGTSERGADSATVHTRAVLDSRDRILVLMTHNTDLGDSFERRSRRPAVLLSDVGARVRLRYQYGHLRVDALTA
jgi:Domain of unknown function (DUF4159)